MHARTRIVSRLIFGLLGSLLAAPIILAASPVDESAKAWSANLDLSYSEANPDFSIFENGDGLSWFAQVAYQDRYFMHYRHNDSAFQPSGLVAGGVVSTWQEWALGYRHRVSESWSAELIYSVQSLKNDDAAIGSETGKQFQVGAVFRPIEDLRFSLHLGRLDLLIDDWTLNFEARYYLCDYLYGLARLRDYADWDFTYYEGGLGIAF